MSLLLQQDKRSFTLVELMFIIIMMGILATIAISNNSPGKEMANWVVNLMSDYIPKGNRYLSKHIGIMSGTDEQIEGLDLPV